MAVWFFLASVVLMEVVVGLVRRGMLRFGILEDVSGAYAFRRFLAFVFVMALCLKMRDAVGFVMVGMAMVFCLVSVIAEMISCVVRVDESWLLCQNAADRRKLFGRFPNLPIGYRVFPIEYSEGGRVSARMGIANAISAARFAVAFVVPGVYLDRPFGGASDAVALVMIFMILATDFVDGKVARKCGLVTDFGKVFDPISDKASQYLTTVGLVIGAGVLPGMDGVPVALAVGAGMMAFLYDVGLAIWWRWGRERVGSAFENKLRSALLSFYIVCGAAAICFDLGWMMTVCRVLFFVVAVYSLLMVIFNVGRVIK